MTDIARLGFAADTSQLKDAKAQLDALTPSAKGAAAAADQVSGALGRAAAGAQGAKGSVTAAAAGVQALNNQLKSVPAAANGATSSLNRLGAAANDNINRLQSTPGNIAAQFQDIGVTAAAGMNPMLIALQQGTQLSSAMSGGVRNLLAGFAQLFSATTLLTIALVGAVAAGLQMIDWMAVAQGLLNGLASGFEMLAGVVEEYSVAITYAGIVSAIAFGPKLVSMILAVSAAILGKLVYALGYATGAMLTFAAANPFGLIVIAIGLVIAAMVALNDTFGGVFTDVLNVVRNAANFIIGALVGAFNAVKATWDMLPDALGDAAYRAADRVRRELNDLVKINGESLINIGAPKGGNPYAGALAKAGAIAAREMGKAQGKDYVAGIGEGIANAARGAGKWLRGVAAGLGADGKPDKSKTAKAARGGMSEEEKLTKAYEEIVKQAKSRAEALRVESNALDMSANAARLYRNEQDLIAKATDRGIKLTADQTAELKGLAAQITNNEISVAFKQQLKSIQEQLTGLRDAGDLIGKYGFELEYAKNRQSLINDAVKAGTIDMNNLTEAMRLQIAMLDNRAKALAEQSEANRAKQFNADMAKSFEMAAFGLERERGELDLTGVALEAYRIETEWLNRAKREGIVLSPETLNALRQEASGHAMVTEAIRKQRELIEFQRTTLKGFFSDMLNGLRQGQSVWEAFGNAVTNVVNKIIDRLLDLATDSLLDSLLNIGQNVGSILNGGGSSGSGSGLTGGFVRGKPIGSANGNVFDGVHRFAKGGAFTNGIYDSTTLFKFAKGASFGMMGEAGPEAVMPLKRGSDGSLGVQVHGNTPPIRVEIGVNDDRFNAYVDDRADGRVATAAPSLANAGASVARREESFVNSRRLA